MGKRASQEHDKSVGREKAREDRSREARADISEYKVSVDPSLKEAAVGQSGPHATKVHVDPSLRDGAPRGHRSASDANSHIGASFRARAGTALQAAKKLLHRTVYGLGLINAAVVGLIVAGSVGLEAADKTVGIVGKWLLAADAYANDQSGLNEAERLALETKGTFAARQKYLADSLAEIGPSTVEIGKARSNPALAARLLELRRTNVRDFLIAHPIVASTATLVLDEIDQAAACRGNKCSNLEAFDERFGMATCRLDRSLSGWIAYNRVAAPSYMQDFTRVASNLDCDKILYT